MHDQRGQWSTGTREGIVKVCIGIESLDSIIWNHSKLYKLDVKVRRGYEQSTHPPKAQVLPAALALHLPLRRSQQLPAYEALVVVLSWLALLVHPPHQR